MSIITSTLSIPEGGLPLKIAHIITSTQVGGAENQLAQLINKCDASEMVHQVMSLKPLGKLAPAMARAGAGVQSLNLTKGPFCLISGFAKLRKWLKGFQPHVIHTWMYHADLMGLMAAKSLGKSPVLWNLRCSNLDLSHYSSSTRLVAGMCRRVSAWPDLIVANSQAGRDWHIKLGYPADKLEVVPNGFDTRRFSPSQKGRIRCRAELGLSDKDLLVGQVSRRDPVKDHAGLIKAFSLLLQKRPDAKLLLIGRGLTPDNPVFSGCNKPPLAGSCFLLGPRSKLEDWYSAMDVYASSSRSEGLPNSVAEAMSCGLVPVATDAGDSRLMVGDCGEVVPSNSPESLAHGLDRVLGMPVQERRALGLSTRRRIERFYSLDAFLASTLGMYRRLAA